jgi:predicted nucleic-acid-binding Zn-ribbon protein
MKPAGVYVCPKCGHKPLAGEDVDTDTGRKLKKLGKNQHQPTKAEKQAWWSQIKFYQRQRVSLGKSPSAMAGVLTPSANVLASGRTA